VLVATYYEARLADLIERVAEALDSYRSGTLDALEVDAVLHRYSKATRELWKFCWSGGSNRDLLYVATSLQTMADEGRTVDWWERAEGRHAR
jgi:hypothetical protein